MVVEMSSPENLGHQFDAVIGDQFPEHLPDGVRQAVERVEKGFKLSDGSKSAFYSSPREDGFWTQKPFLQEHTTHPAVVQALSKQGRLDEVLPDLARTGRISHPDVHKAIVENEIVLRGKSIAKNAEDMLKDTGKND
jgi:hypothetical protein